MAHTPLLRSLLRTLQAARRANLKASGQPAPLTHGQLQQSRRRFLKAAGIAGVAGCGASLLPGVLPAALATGPMPGARVAIIGAGLAGLNAAFQLKKAGIRAEVYEASERLGGRVLSRTGLVGDGLVTELGAEFINTDHHDMLSLAQEFKLPLFNRNEDAARLAFPRTGYFLEGKTWEEKDLAALLQPLAAQITADADRLAKDPEKYTKSLDRLSVSAYLDRHVALIPKPVVRTLIENTIRSEYGVEPSASSVLQLLYLLPTADGKRIDLLSSSDEAFCVDGGNSRIIDGLAAALDGQIHTGSFLDKLTAHRTDSLRLRFRNKKEIEAEYVILAIPFTVLRQVHIEASLPDALRAFIREVNLGANEKVMAGYANRAWRHVRGFVGEAWGDFGFSEVWDATQRQGKRDDAALTYYLGGREAAAAFSIGEAEVMGRAFTQRLTAYVPDLGKSATGRYARTGWTRNPLTLGAYTSFRPGQISRFGKYRWIESEKPAERQAVRVGRLLFAGEHLSDEYYGFMNGAAQTGRLAAEVVVKAMARTKSS